MTSLPALIEAITAARGGDREELWVTILHDIEARTVLELGVWEGAFAERLLDMCPSITCYYMLDPWRHLDGWNKPANVDDRSFELIYSKAISRTDFAGERRIVLRGTTLEMIDRIPDGALDLAYIDADHTLRGIAIDLIRTYPKIRPGGVLGGDDYTPSIWQHPTEFEPTLVCPFAAYFAESQGAPIVILPHNQFAIIKPLNPGGHFQILDCTQRYGERVLLGQIAKK